jgi:hypothetical protein
MEGAAISLLVGKTKELYSCSGVEGAVEKGSDSTSWMVGAVLVVTERLREWWEEGLCRELRDLWWETEGSWPLDGFEAWCEVGGEGAVLEGTKGSL